MDTEETRVIIREIVMNTLMKAKKIPIAASNRHIHLSTEHVERLFGRGYQLRKLRDLSQPNQFAAKETVALIGPRGKIPNVRVLGPARGSTQVEVSLYDGFTLGVNPPVRNSGDIKDSESITIQGPRGQVKIEEGLIAAARHIHMHTMDAHLLDLSDGDRVQVRVDGERGVIFSNVLVRVSDNYQLEMHIDLDEANASAIRNGQFGEIVCIESKKQAGGG
jgi:putative phosphotransacetylase